MANKQSDGNKEAKMQRGVSKHNSLIKLLLGLYHANVPTMIWSRPGCGKTATVMSMGEILNVPTVIRSGNKSDPTDFSGIPYIVNDKIHFSKPSYVELLEQNPKGILFFDEINTCPTQIQVALLSIIQDCSFGEYSIPKSVFRVAAGNYAETLGNRAMSPALMNRFVHLFVEPDAEAWTNGFISGFENYERPVYCQIGSEKYAKKLLKYRQAVTEFIKMHPNYLNVYPEEIVDKEDVAFPTQRSWDMATQLLACLDENEEEYVFEILCGVVGTSAAPLFLSFLRGYEGVGIELSDFVGREDEFVLPNPNKHDHVKQIMDSMVYYLKLDPNKYFKLWIRMLNVLFNKNNKFGDYIGYSTFIAMYARQNIDTLMKAGVVSKNGLKDLSNQVDGWSEFVSILGL